MVDNVAQGGHAAADGVAAASQGLQAFATEMQRASQESMEHATRVLEQLRGAKSVEEVTSIQTAFLQQAFQRYTDFTTRISELMASSQSNFMQQSRAAMQAFRPPIG